MPSAIIIGKISQSKGDWVLDNFRISVGKEDRVVQTLIEYTKPARGIRGVQFATKKTVQSLAEAGTPDSPSTLNSEGVIGQNREVGYMALKI
jgi:hypothetical protein